MALIGLGTACPVVLAQGQGVATVGAEDVPFVRTEGPRETLGSFLELERLLEKEGKILDPHGHEVWMPRETQYAPVYEGTYVDAFVADPDAVLISKACKAPEKNKALITEYLAKGASERFFKLATKYAVDLEHFV